MRLSKTAVLAFFAVYLIWGSTYLAIKFAIESIAPWSLSTLRFFIAGLIMFAIALVAREKRVTQTELRIAVISGPLLVVANGIVCVVEQWVASGVAALIIGAMPIWILFIGWIGFKQPKPDARKLVGALVGLAGIGLIASGNLSSGSANASFGNFVLIGSSWLWAIGTLIQRRALKVQSPFLFSSLQMIAGSLVTGAFALWSESPFTHDWSHVTSTSWLALVYLIIFGSLIAFTAYGWLSRNLEPHLVSTYALVNPVVAVALGSLFYREPITAKFLVATVLVAAGLALFVLKRPQARGV